MSRFSFDVIIFNKCRHIPWVRLTALANTVYNLLDGTFWHSRSSRHLPLCTTLPLKQLGKSPLPRRVASRVGQKWRLSIKPCQRIARSLLNIVKGLIFIGGGHGCILIIWFDFRDILFWSSEDSEIHDIMLILMFPSRWLRRCSLPTASIPDHHRLSPHCSW